MLSHPEVNAPSIFAQWAHLLAAPFLIEPGHLVMGEGVRPDSAKELGWFLTHSQSMELMGSGLFLC